MLKFMDGFDQFLGIAGQDMAATLAAAGYTTTGTTLLDVGRTSDARCLAIGDAQDTASSLKRTFTSTSQKAVIGFAYCAGQRADIVNIANLGALTWNPDNARIGFGGGTGTASVLLDLWYYFEIVIDKANSLLQVYINNAKDIEAPLPDEAKFLTIFETTWASAAGIKKLDDIVFVDAQTPGKYVDRVGPIAIACRLPTQDVDRDWSPATGTDHFAMVDNTPPKDGEYIQSNVSGAYDTFLSSAGVPSGAQVVAVGLVARNRKSDIDNRQLGMVVGRKGQSTLEVVDTNLTTTPKYSYAVFETAPANAAWTAENATTQPFGVIVRP